MTPRLFTAAVVTWAAGLSLFAAVVRWTGPSHPPRPPATSALARSLNAALPDDRAWQWSVTHAQAAQGALVVETVMLNPADALANARAIVEPVRAKYSEVLVYVRPVSPRRALASRRVQWTPGNGYVEMILAETP